MSRSWRLAGEVYRVCPSVGGGQHDGAAGEGGLTTDGWLRSQTLC